MQSLLIILSHKRTLSGGDIISKVIEHLTNPTRAKIFYEIVKADQTVKTLLQTLPEISQPTMYRHIKTLLDSGLILITSEKQVRGVTEKTYGINPNAAPDIQRIIEENDGDAYYKLFIQFITGVAQEFEAYSRAPNINILEDCSAFSLAPFYATKEELMEMMGKIAEIITPLMQNASTPERQLRSFYTILAPPKKE